MHRLALSSLFRSFPSAAKSSHFSRFLLWLLIPALGWPMVMAQAGQTIQVANGDVAGLIAAIQTLNSGGGGTIELANGGVYDVSAASDWWYGPNAFPAIASSIKILGNESTITRVAGSPNFRFFFVSGGLSTQPAGSLTLENLTLSGGLAEGGSGGSGSAAGGGGGGFGGAIYNQGTLTLSSVTFSQNEALGGSGGGATELEQGGSSGGGGLGGNGGSATASEAENAAGGGGFKGNGTHACYSNPSCVDAGGGFLGTEGAVYASGGTSTFGGNGASSGPGGGGSGGGGYGVGQNGGQNQNNYVLSGGTYIMPGGAGAFAAGNGGYGDGAQNVYGGGGGAFGGGGAGSTEESGGGGGIGGGGGGGYQVAGNGGFGGGGGGGYTSGNGGFGGGGGGTFLRNIGYGGFGGANGQGAVAQSGTSPGGAGGGGAGLGGAIFNQLGTVKATSSAFTGNSATGGSGYGTASGFGGGIFNLDGSVTLTSITYTDNTAVNTAGAADGGAFVYNLSHNGGNTNATEVPTATLTLTNFNLSTSNGDLVNNQTDGTATVILPSPALSISGTPVAFGNVGYQTISVARTVTLTALTTGGPVALTSVQIAGANAAQFSLTNQCGATIAPGTSCKILVQFTPNAVSAFSASLAIADNVHGSPQTIALTGTGVAAHQTLTFPAPASPVSFSVGEIGVSATASSGLPVMFAISGPATGNEEGNGAVIFTGVGTVTITAIQEGNQFYLPVQLSHTVVVTQAHQTIAFPAIAPVTFGTGPISLSATATSSLPVSFSVVSGPGSIPSGSNQLTITGGGTVVVTATQAGNANYVAATSVRQSITVHPTTQTVTFGALTPVTYGNPPVTLTATASSGLTPSFSVVSGPGKIAGNQLTVTGAGPITISATQAGNASYSAATPVQQILHAYPAPLTISINQASRNYGAANPTTYTSSLSGLINGDKVTLSYQTLATKTSPVGYYDVTATITNSAASKYTLQGGGSLFVAPAPVTVTVVNTEMVYGSAVPTFTSKVTGLVNGDTASVSYDSPASSTLPPGVYPIYPTVVIADAGNYNVTQGIGTITILKAPLHITANSFTIAHGSPIPTLTYTVTGFVNGDTQASALTGAPTLSTTATSSSPAGSYAIVIGQGTLASSLYSKILINGTLTITP